MKIMKLLKDLLYKLKWIGVVLSVVYGLLFIESATDGYGISGSEEYIMYTFWISLIVTILLFYFEKKWLEICDKILEYIDKKRS